ncbi:Phosphatidylinositide phosphatase SAC1 [Gryllus bimaculatus]|nr:Phosphatidylinositide phosphatase SAC1 [Gryllus bimaculatus]
MPTDSSVASIELFRTDQFYIFIKGECGLWWDRVTGEFIAKKGWDLVNTNDPCCLGVFFGIIGKIEFQSLETRLVLIKECVPVGDLPGGKTVFKIKSVVFLPLGLSNENNEISLQPCKKHTASTFSKASGSSGGIFDIHQKAAFAKTWGTIKSATNTIKNTTQQAAALATSQVKSGKRRDSKDREKFERRILEELQRIFTDTDSFYFCLSGDLTNSLQRQNVLRKNNEEINHNVMWKSVDERFFWNKNMLQDIINLNNPLADPWVLPVIQGFIQIEHCKVEVGPERYGSGNLENRYETFTLCLISRRSRFRAGTRYKRRGVDEDGKCANYVETEQIVAYHHHQVSFVQVRGSVPVFWSQPGYKYRPPPCLDKGDKETHVAFEKHFEEELQIYGPVCAVSLVEQAGKEKIIWDAYTNHILTYDSPDITYVTFDFHEYCRGMHFENVSVLIASLVDIIKDMGYCWRDREGMICQQKGIFRVNCIDCLDRTNVVQTALAKAVMEIQFTKLGLIPPEGVIPSNIRNTFQLLWANNGDIISKQYAGTNALKGDYTRTGERKFTGMMKDSMNSANRYLCGHFVDSYRQAGIDIMQGQEVNDEDLNDCSCELQTAFSIAQALVPLPRTTFMSEIALGPEIKFATAVYHISRYYLSRFKDAYRQATIDMMLGNIVSEDLLSQEKADDEDASATAEHVKLLIEDCKKMLISDTDMILGAWGLIDADPVSGDPTETEMDTILILTRDAYYVAEYDDQLDRIMKYQQVLLKDLTLIEFGTPESSVSLFKNSQKCGHHCIRLHYTVSGTPGYYHMFRSTNLRFFNNMAVGIKTDEEMIESLKAVCEAFLVALEIAGLPVVPFVQGKLDRKKSKLLSMTGSNNATFSYLDIAHLPHMTRNVSESQLLSFKNAGSKAISNVTQQFNKLNRLGHSFNTRKSKPKSEEQQSDKVMETMFTVGVPDNSSQQGLVSCKHSSDEDDDPGVFNLPSGVLLQPHHSLGPILSHVKHRNVDVYLPSVGILMTSKFCSKAVECLLEAHKVRTINLLPNITPAPFIDNVSLSRVVQNVSIHGHVLTHSRTDLSLDVSGLFPQEPSSGSVVSKNSSLCPSPHRPGSATPEITVENTASIQDTSGMNPKTVLQGESQNITQMEFKSNSSKLTPPNTLQLARKLSHSSDEVDKRQVVRNNDVSANVEFATKSTGGSLLLNDTHRSSSERDLSLNITSSQSENALRSFRSGFTNAITSPVAVTKDLVLSPFSKLAKGMQNIGANLDPRKLKGPVGMVNLPGLGRQPMSEQHAEEVRKLTERFHNCRSRLIAL